MKVHWIVEGGVFGEETHGLAYAVAMQGHACTTTPKNPFFAEDRIAHLNLLLGFDIRTANECVLYLGSCSTVGWVQENTIAEPAAAWSRRDKFLCSSYYRHFGKYMMNSPYVFVQVAELIRMLDFYFDTFGNEIDGEMKIFLRSDSGSKIISGGLMTKSNIRGFFTNKRSNFAMPYDDVMLLIAKPIAISREYRLVISGKSIVTGSQYLPTESSDIPDHVMSYANEVLENTTWDHDELCRMWTLDIAELPSTRCKVIEINSFNSSGLYKSDMKAVVKEANRLAIEDFEEYGSKTE